MAGGNTILFYIINYGIFHVQQLSILLIDPSKVRDAAADTIDSGFDFSSIPDYEDFTYYIVNDNVLFITE